MGLGHDDSIVYVRTQKEIDYSKRQSPSKRQFDWIYIGFCGKVYPAVIVYDFDAEKPTRGVCYNVGEVDKFVHAHFCPNDIEVYEGSSKKRYLRCIYSYGSSTHKGIESTFEKAITEKWGYPYAKYFSEHNTPIFVVDPPENKIFINCLLKPYEFYKVFDPYTAFQEISMYVGGVLLAPVNPIPAIPDNTMRDIKGFDKWSFRKEPKS